MRTLVVPTEPTAVMISAMAESLGEIRADRRLDRGVLRAVYRAALSARVGELYPMPALNFREEVR